MFAQVDKFDVAWRSPNLASCTRSKMLVKDYRNHKIIKNGKRAQWFILKCFFDAIKFMNLQYFCKCVFLLRSEILKLSLCYNHPWVVALCYFNSPSEHCLYESLYHNRELVCKNPQTWLFVVQCEHSFDIYNFSYYTSQISDILHLQSTAIICCHLWQAWNTLIMIITGS